MAARKGRKGKAAKEIEGLIEAASFAKLGIDDKNAQPFAFHFIIRHGWIIGFNGIVAAGHKIGTDIEAYPHGPRFLAALQRCRKQVSLTALESGRLSVVSGEFRAYVECITPELFPPVAPSARQADCGQPVLDGLKIVSRLTSDQADRIHLATVLLGNGTVTATNGHLLIQHWHGYNMPPVSIPKSSVAALLRAGKDVSHVGVDFAPDGSGEFNAITFWFGEDAFIKTQLYAGQWPDLTNFFDRTNDNPIFEIGDDFFDVMEDLAPFAKDGYEVASTGGEFVTHLDDEVTGAEQTFATGYEFRFNVHSALLLRGLVNKVVWLDGNKSFFFGDKNRAVLAHKIPLADNA